MGLDTVELVMTWERDFSLSIPNDIASTLVTPEAAASAIGELLSKEGRPMDPEEIHRIIKQGTLEVSSLPEHQYRRDGRFVEDFGLD